MKKIFIRKKKNNFLVLLVALAAILLGSGTFQTKFNNLVKSSGITSFNKNIGNISNDDMFTKTYQSGDSAYVYVNHNKSELDPNSWNYDHVEYGNLDNLNRTTKAVAYLDKSNLVQSNTRTRQVWNPTGWHQKRMNIDGKNIEILNRGHLIAYSVTGKLDNNGNFNPSDLGSLDNPKNLATQTAFSNQKTMQIFEEKVRNALKQNKKVVYRVSTIFKGNDLMPSGYHSQAISTDGTLNFNVYIWNVQPGVQFDYATGRSQMNQNMKVPNPMKKF